MPDDVLETGRKWLLDLIGVAVAGSQTRLSRIIKDHSYEHFAPGHRKARMLFDGRATSPVGAALAGGMTIDAMDGHDGHKLTKGHVGCGVLPALHAFAQAEAMDDDRAFLASLVVGYEIGTRTGIALHRTASDYHTSGAWVAVAAAALGARTLGLGVAQTREALGIAEYHGPRSQMMRAIDHPTMVKDGSGWGAMAGVSAAYLAQDGFTGAPALTVEGADVADLWGDLGRLWRIEEQYFKHFPVCRWAQPAIQGILDLRISHGLTSEDVERIEIVTFHEAVRLATRAPRTTEEAQYSTCYPSAVAMVHGRVGPGDIMIEGRTAPEVRRLSDGMIVRESDTFNAAFPARRFAEVTLILRSGQRLVSGRMEAKGDPEDPASIADVRAKFQANAEPVLGPKRAMAIERAIDGLGRGDGLATFQDLICAPCGRS
nr:MmgE/PrpD family protein [Jannaschia donghaensis]